MMLIKHAKSLSFAILCCVPLPGTAEGSTSLGVSLGSPSGVNFVVRSEELGIPLQLSGAYWGDRVSGIELGYSFYQRYDSVFHSAQFIAGYSDTDDDRSKSKTWAYTGISGTFKKGGFFFEPGLTVGSGDYSNPQLTFQIGWLWEL